MAITRAADGSDGRRYLEEAGVFLDHCAAADLPESRLAGCLGVDERQVRAIAVLGPADAPDASPELGAWHINAERELHLLRSGSGQFEFVTPHGIVCVLMEPGDVIEIRRVEHRFRAFTSTTWVLRYSGAANAELSPKPTGRVEKPWLDVEIEPTVT
jgi:hypothetical protein